MPNRGEVGRDPDAPKRTERALRQMADILNDLTRSGQVFRGKDGNWEIDAAATSDLPPISFGISGRHRPRPFFFPGIQGDTGAAGATGPSGSSGGDSPPAIYRHPRFRNVFPVGIDTLDLPGTSTKFLAGNGVWATPGQSSGWEVSLEQTGDESVTNSTTLTSSSYLQTAVTAGSYWYFRALILYSGDNATADIKFALTVSAGNFRGIHQWLGERSTSDAASAGQVRDGSAATWTTPLALGCDTTHEIRQVMFEQLAAFDSSATLSLQFAQNSAGGAGTEVTLHTGSLLQGVRLV